MIRLTEGALFLSLATGLHLGLWAAVPGSNTAQQTAPHSTASLAELLQAPVVLVVPARHSASISVKLMQEMAGATVIESPV